jgi:hypothetical protein
LRDSHKASAPSANPNSYTGNPAEFLRGLLFLGYFYFETIRFGSNA